MGMRKTLQKHRPRRVNSHLIGPPGLSVLSPVLVVLTTLFAGRVAAHDWRGLLWVMTAHSLGGHRRLLAAGIWAFAGLLAFMWYRVVTDLLLFRAELRLRSEKDWAVHLESEDTWPPPPNSPVP